MAEWAASGSPLFFLQGSSSGLRKPMRRLSAHLEEPIWHLKFSNSSLVNPNIKSSGKRSMFLLTCLLSCWFPLPETITTISGDIPCHAPPHYPPRHLRCDPPHLAPRPRLYPTALLHKHTLAAHQPSLAAQAQDTGDSKTARARHCAGPSRRGVRSCRGRRGRERGSRPYRC